MRLEGNWVIAENGQDRRAFHTVMNGDQYKYDSRLARGAPGWHDMGFNETIRYHDADEPGLLNRRHKSKCSPEIMALLVPQDTTLAEHFI